MSLLEQLRRLILMTLTPRSSQAGEERTPPYLQPPTKMNLISPALLMLNQRPLHLRSGLKLTIQPADPMRTWTKPPKESKENKEVGLELDHTSLNHHQISQDH